MTSKIKALGLAFIAIAVMSAIAASSAQAGAVDVQNIQTQSAVGTAVDEGPDHSLVLQKTNGTEFPVTCQDSRLEGTVAQQAGQDSVGEATATATYAGVCQFNALNATVQLNGCKYTLTGTGQAANTALVDVVGCTVGTPYIAIQVTGCQLRVPEQNGLSHVVGVNEQTGGVHNGKVTLEATASSITTHQVGLACPDGNNHKSTRAVFQGNTVVSGRADEGADQVTEHNHQFNKFKVTGAAVNLTST